MKGIRIEKYKNEINQINEIIAKYPDIEQVSILHEILDDTPFKTENYTKYNHDEYYIKHNKSNIIKDCTKFYQLYSNLQQNKDEDNLIELISERNSERDYTNNMITFEDFSMIIHYSMGIKNIGRGVYNQKEFPFRYCNSQGGLNHLDLYLIINNIEKIEQGLYYYDFLENKIWQMDRGNMRGIIGEINFQNEFSIYGNFLAIITSDLSRVAPKYFKRSYRMAHVDAGIVGAYLQLLSEKYKIKSCIIAGYLEHNLEKLLNLTENDYPIVTISFGQKGELV